MDQKTSTATTMTEDEAHERIGKDKISRASVFAAVKRREIPHLRLGRRILIPRRAFDEWLKNAGMNPAA